MLFTLLLSFAWKDTLSAPGLIPPPSQRVFDYPDSFSLRDAYYKELSVEHYTVQSEDTFSQVCQKFGIPAATIQEWRQSCTGFSETCLLQPGDEFTFHRHRGDPEPYRFVYTPGSGPGMVFRKAEEHWECWKNEEEQTFSVTQTVNGSITDNLFDAAVQAGLSPRLVMDLAGLFECAIDFTSDLQSGDSFSVHFEQQVNEGKRLQTGPILAAEMMVGGKEYQAFSYQFADGYKDYFTAEGKSLRRLFLKAPLSFSRISSTFTRKRFHPILKTFRPHFGIDYAAPTGTPVSALGGGTITFIGTKGGYGKYIEIRHNSTYKTAYGHLSRFARGLKAGSKVEQGDVIGYVGATGLATGPHLDFRFYRNGKPIDFLKADFPHARSIPRSLQADFKEKVHSYLSAMRSGRLARTDETPKDN